MQWISQKDKWLPWWSSGSSDPPQRGSDLRGGDQGAGGTNLKTQNTKAEKQ